MRQIIHLEVGGTGIHISDEFWRVVCIEHRIDPVGNYYGDNDALLQYADSYFREDNGKYIPRAILVAANSTNILSRKRSQFGKLHDRRNSISGNGAVINSFPAGFRDDAKMCDQTFESIRREAEYCDNLRGFQICHSIGSGIGAGFGSLLMTKLKEDYSKNFISTFSNFNFQNVTAEHYNSMLSISFLRDYADQTFLIDGEATGYICKNCLEIEKPTRFDINHVIAQSLAGITSCLRFPGNYDIDIGETNSNMIPEPNMHFFMPGLSPISSIKPQKEALTVTKLASAMFTNNCWLGRCDTKKGKFISVTAIFRGPFSTTQVNDGIAKTVERYYKSKFINWMSHNIKIGICKIPPPEYEYCATFIGHSTNMHTVLKRMKQKCSTFDKRSYSGSIPNFTNIVHGIDELIEQYGQYHS